MSQRRPGPGMGKSSVQIDHLKESERQLSIFRASEDQDVGVDFPRLRNLLEGDGQIPKDVVQSVLSRIQGNMEHLGLDKPPASLIHQWLMGLLREQGYSLGELPLQSLALSLGDVELNIFHPLGTGRGADQNPEASSQRIAQRIKTQFASKRVFQEDVIQAHDDGDLELLHLGAIDRPHDVYLTPEYLKANGLPVTSGAPSAGPAKRADVLLAHLIRFTHELQNHFAGDIQWGYVNTLMLPFLEPMSHSELHQFVQQLLFEFAQLDVERGGLYRKVILDFDFDLPRQLMGLPALGPGGEPTGKTYGEYEQTLTLFNEVTLDVLDRGDYRSNPFHSPQIVYHFNQPKATWHGQHQYLMEIAFRRGNPSVSFSYYERKFGPLGHMKLNDPDFLQLIQTPANLRGFSSSTVAINLARLAHPQSEFSFEQRLDRVMDLAVSVHRQKRLFLSRLMAYGNRGPLQFLRHKVNDVPFLKIAHAAQPMQLIGLAEAAALMNGSPVTQPEALGVKALQILEAVRGALEKRNQMHKLKMSLSGTHHESVAYRFAALDLRRYGRPYSTYVLHKPDQAHPIYTEGANILAYANLPWRDRMRIEGKLHQAFGGHQIHYIYLKDPTPDDRGLYQKIFQEAREHGINQIFFAPDQQICLTCFKITNQSSDSCASCKSSMVTPYGFCQAGFSPVHSWCLGKRSEWLIRHRIDSYRAPIQTQLPLLL